MKRGPALLAAGAVAGALVSGAVGYGLRVGAEVATTQPAVKTITRTVTIHAKKANPHLSLGRVSSPAAHSTGGSSTGSDSDSGDEADGDD